MLAPLFRKNSAELTTKEGTCAACRTPVFEPHIFSAATEKRSDGPGSPKGETKNGSVFALDEICWGDFFMAVLIEGHFVENFHIFQIFFSAFFLISSVFNVFFKNNIGMPIVPVILASDKSRRSNCFLIFLVFMLFLEEKLGKSGKQCSIRMAPSQLFDNFIAKCFVAFLFRVLSSHL